MNANNQMPRILLVENDKRVRESYRVLLRYWGYFPVFAVGEGRSLIRDASAKARKFHCLLALIDLRLLDDFDEDDTSGLQLAQDLNPVRSIILSGYPNQKILRELLDKHKDIPFLSKADAPEKIKKTLDREAGKICALKRGLQIRPPELIDQISQTTFSSLITEYPDQIADILAQLLPGAKNLRIERLDSSLFSSHASDVPRPQSVVLKVYEEDYEPVVVKLARAKKIEVEVERYEKFISRKIGGNFTARLERYANLWDIGGALYTYIGDFDVKTFSSYYEEHPIEDIRECLEAFFTVSWGRHYERRQLQINVSLFDLYADVWGDWYIKRVRDYPTLKLWQDEGINKWLELPNPIEWFKTRIAEDRESDLSIVETTQRAITHGDLHGDNLLIDSRKNAWVIDFERSGEGHALQDFIELESDIINRLETPSENISSYYQMCQVVARQTSIKPLEEGEMKSPDPRIRKALQTISLLRSLALKCTGIFDARQYLLGLLFNTIFRATINNNEKHRDRQIRALRLAGIFCHRLDHWNESWPPEEWKPILQYQEETCSR
jgi:CheY-like chemotaxis protein